MKKILFVCYGNICRSPIAEYIFKSITDNKYIVESRATSNEEIDNDIYYLAKEVLDKNNIKYSRHYAKRLTIDDYNNFDIIICFDDNNIRDIKRITNDLSKVRKLNNNVDDPWYTRDFDKAFNEIYNGCLNLKNILEK